MPILWASCDMGFLRCPYLSIDKNLFFLYVDLLLEFCFMPNDASVSAFVGYIKILAFVFTGEDGDKFSLKVGILGNPPLVFSPRDLYYRGQKNNKRIIYKAQ